MSSGFKMKGSAFYGKKVSYGPAKQGQVNPARPEYRPTAAGEEQMLEDAGAFKQGTTLPASAGGMNVENTFGGAIGSGPTSGPIEPSADTQALAAAKADKKMSAAGGRKWKPGGSPATQVNPKPAKRGAGNLSEAQREYEATKGMSGAPTTQRRKPKDKHDKKLNPNRDI